MYFCFNPCQLFHLSQAGKLFCIFLLNFNVKCQKCALDGGWRWMETLSYSYKILFWGEKLLLTVVTGHMSTGFNVISNSVLYFIHLSYIFYFKALMWNITSNFSCQRNCVEQRELEESTTKCVQNLSKCTHIWGRLKLKANSCRPACRTVRPSSGQSSSERQRTRFLIEL